MGNAADAKYIKCNLEGFLENMGVKKTAGTVLSLLKEESKQENHPKSLVHTV